MQLWQKLTGLRVPDQRPRRSATAACSTPPSARSSRREGQPSTQPWPCCSASMVQQLEERHDSHQHASTSASVAPEGHSTALEQPVPPSPNGAIPSCSRPQTSALVTPSKLAALSEALRMPVRQLQELLQQSPQLLTVPPEHLATLQQALQEELSLSPHAARQLITRQPKKVLTTPPPELQQQATDLAKQLGVAPKEILQAAGKAPSMLGREPQVIAGQLRRMAEALGGLPMTGMVRLAAAATQFLTDSPASVALRLASFSKVLNRPPRLIVRALAAQPDMLFMSPRVLRNKLGVLQAILDRQPRLVVPLLLACPGLLRCDMDGVRAAYTMLQPISARDADFTFGMVCHAPHLLLEHPQLLAAQARHVQHVARQVPHWHMQLSKLNPAQAADCLGHSAPTFARLNYLAATQQADGLSLHAVLTMPRSAFLKRFPGAAGLNKIVKQPMQLAPIPRWQGAPASHASHGMPTEPRSRRRAAEAGAQARHRDGYDDLHHHQRMSPQLPLIDGVEQGWQDEQEWQGQEEWHGYQEWQGQPDRQGRPHQHAYTDEDEAWDELPQGGYPRHPIPLQPAHATHAPQPWHTASASQHHGSPYPAQGQGSRRSHRQARRIRTLDPSYSQGMVSGQGRHVNSSAQGWDPADGMAPGQQQQQQQQQEGQPEGQSDEQLEQHGPQRHQRRHQLEQQAHYQQQQQQHWLPAEQQAHYQQQQWQQLQWQEQQQLPVEQHAGQHEQPLAEQHAPGRPATQRASRRASRSASQQQQQLDQPQRRGPAEGGQGPGTHTPGNGLVPTLHEETLHNGSINGHHQPLAQPQPVLAVHAEEASTQQHHHHAANGHRVPLPLPFQYRVAAQTPVFVVADEDLVVQGFADPGSPDDGLSAPPLQQPVPVVASVQGMAEQSAAQTDKVEVRQVVGRPRSVAGSKRRKQQQQEEVDLANGSDGADSQGEGALHVMRLGSQRPQLQGVLMTH